MPIEERIGRVKCCYTQWRRAEAQALVESLPQGSAGESEGVRTATKNKTDALLISPFHKQHI
jgi:hypothetical protein